MTRAEAVVNAHAWFEVNSGWAPPDAETLEDWAGDGVCRCPDDCLVAPDTWCEHGLASWALVLEAVDEADRAAHPAPVVRLASTEGST
ncbi:MAG: hypothetical protein H0T70_05540 [Acidimicrobiia bacterium]|nr:hypothetical protein [Acidimicrobiia bacterium]